MIQSLISLWKLGLSVIVKRTYCRIRIYFVLPTCQQLRGLPLLATMSSTLHCQVVFVNAFRKDLLEVVLQVDLVPNITIYLSLEK